MRLLIADDDTLLRSALATVLGLDPNVEVVGQAEDGLQAVALAQELVPDVALVDVDMPGATGLEVAERLRDSPTRVVIITRHARPSHLTQAMRAGAAGFVLKSTPSDRLVQILGDVLAGHRFVDPEIAALALTMRPCSLTDRELDVLREVHRGRTTEQVAAALHLAPGTVRNYVSSALTKLGVRSGREAAAHAWNEGWI